MEYKMSLMTLGQNKTKHKNWGKAYSVTKSEFSVQAHLAGNTNKKYPEKK